MAAKHLSPKELTEREKRVEAMRAKDGISRAHGASVIDAEEVAKKRKPATTEEIAEQFKCEELKQQPSRTEGAQ